MTPESIVKSQVNASLGNLLLSGDVFYFQRVNSGKIRTDHGTWVQMAEKGHFDFVALFQDKHRNLVKAFIECKRSDKLAKYDPDQIKFMNKYSGKHPNMMFWLVQSGDEVKKLVLANCFNRVNDIIFTP